MTSTSPVPDPWGDMTPAWGTPAVAPAEPDPDPSTTEGLIDLLHKQRDLLEDVATGKVYFTTDPEAGTVYRNRGRAIRAALRRYSGVENPFPWLSLSGAWDHMQREWHGAQARRVGLDGLLGPAVHKLEEFENVHKLQDVSLSGDAAWASLEGRVAELVVEYSHASTLDGFQDVARRSREILKDAVNLVYAPSMCPEGQPQPKDDDPQTKFDYIVGDAAEGSSGSRLRRWLRATWGIANHTAHSESHPRASAFASGQSALTLARTLHLLAQDVDNSPDPGGQEEPDLSLLIGSGFSIVPGCDLG